jgi:hypothetical protein
MDREKMAKELKSHDTARTRDHWNHGFSCGLLVYTSTKLESYGLAIDRLEGRGYDSSEGFEQSYGTFMSRLPGQYQPVFISSSP